MSTFERDISEDCLTSLSETFGKRRRQTIAAPCAPCCESDMCNNNCEQGISTPFSNSTTATAPNSGYEGQEFVFMFISSHYMVINADPNVMVVSKPASVVNVVLPTNFGNRTFTVNQTGLLDVNLSKEFYMDRNTVENKAIILRSSAPATVFAMNAETFLTEGFPVFQSSSCSNHYIVPAFPPVVTSVYSNIGIVSLFHDNYINIDIRTTSGQITINGTGYGNGDTVNLNLQKYETFQLANNYDLTGTEIRASNPVCVTAGSHCARVFLPGTHCSRLEEMILPVKYFTSSFIVPSLHEWPGYKIRILSANDNTTLMWNTSQAATNNVTLQVKGSYKELKVSNVMTYIESSSPVTVAQYSILNTDNGDPHNSFMMLIPGLSQYKNVYNFAVPGSTLISKATVIVPSVEANGLLLDDKALSILPGSRDSMFVGNIQYEAFTVSVSPGAHTMKHINLKPFGLFIYGRANDYYSKGYGYSAGFKLI